MIFINPDKPYGYFKKDISEVEWSSRNSWSNENPTGKDVDDAINLLTDHMNKKIRDVNELNESVRKKNRKWFVLILIGFVIQIIGTFLIV